MKIKPLYGLIAVIGLVLVVIVTMLFVPSETSPAFAVAVNFVERAGDGEEALAKSALSPELLNYVAQTCPEQQISQCVDAYTPEDWGKFLSAVFRRAQPDGQGGWHVQVIATYEKGQGFSGVCIYTHVAQTTSGEWQIDRWSGWMSCDEPNAGLNDLIDNETVPNRAP